MFDVEGTAQKWVTTANVEVPKVKVWTFVIAPLTWVRLVTSSALQPRKWQLIGMSQWCCSALCGRPLPADNWTHSAASRHTIASVSHTRPSLRSCSYYSFPVPLRIGGWVGLSTQYRLASCSRLLAVYRVWVEPATSWLQVRYSTTRPLHPLKEEEENCLPEQNMWDRNVGARLVRERFSMTRSMPTTAMTYWQRACV